MLSKFSVKKPLTVIVSAIIVAILGIISMGKMTTDLLPSMDLPYIIVMTTYPGASPEKVEIGVTKPLEKILATTSGVKEINSVSNENSSMVMLEFEENTNMDSIVIEMSSKIDLVESQFEKEVGTPMIMKMNPNMMPIMVASIDIDNKDVNEVSKIVKESIIPKFEKIEGVASVDGSGLVENKLKIAINDSKIDELNNKLLASIDTTLSEKKSQLDSAKSKLKEAKDILNNESNKKTEEIVDSSIKLEDGKHNLEEALNNIPKIVEQLNTKKDSILQQKNILENIISWQDKNGIPILDIQNSALEKLNESLNQIESAIGSINGQTSDMNDKFNKLVEAEKQIEVAKLTLNRELVKASITIEKNESEIEKGYKEFDKAKEEAYKKAGLKDNITRDNINKILMAENFSMPAGYINDGDDKYLVKIGDKFKDKNELENLLLFDIPNDDIGKIYLKDIASVEFTDNSKELYAKINGNDGVVLSFQKQSTASTSNVSKKINKQIKEIEAENLGLHITPLQDQGVYIDVVINSVFKNLILGGILAIIILYIFLKNLKPTLIIAISIPISLLFALAMMYFSGVTINIISLSGLALGVGMLVDNSIVVIENIYRMRNDGATVKEAAVKGATQVAGAIAASTLTTICVFLPIVFTQGMARQMFTDMGLTIAYSLIASLIVALTLVPTMSSKMLKKINSKQMNTTLFSKFINIYEKSLRFSLKHKTIILVTTGILLIVSIVSSISKGAILMPEIDSNQISISMKMDSDTKDVDLRNMSNKLIDRVLEIDDIKTIGAMQSSGSPMGGSSTKSVSYYVLLKEDKDHTSSEIADMITEKTSDLNCKISVHSSSMDMSSLGGSGVEVIVKGDDLDKLKDIAINVSSLIQSIDGTTDINNGIQESVKETKINIDKNKAMEYGLTIAQIYGEISNVIKEELNSTNIKIDSQEYPVILVNETENPITKENIGEYSINAVKDGKEVKIKLNEIATITEDPSLTSINRNNQVRTLSVKAKVDSTHNVGLVSNEVEKVLENIDLPEGYSVELSGEKESMDETFTDLINMILLSIIFIYAIMVAQFQSFKSPFIVLFTIPLAFTGGFFALVITGFNISMISLLGFLILSGIVVNNGIVFVDYVNQLILDGIDINEALIITGKTRVRPILMTALTTILGLSTLAMGIGMGADMIQPMAIVTIGGLAYATVMTLFIVPIIYALMHRKTKLQE